MNDTSALRDLYKFLTLSEITNYYRTRKIEALDKSLAQEGGLDAFLEPVRKYYSATLSATPIASIVIPAYNEQYELFLTLLSLTLLDTNGSPVEIIVVDNNSTDNTKLVAECFGAKVVECKEQGVQHARMMGYKSVSDSSKYIWFMDADTRVSPPFNKVTDAIPSSAKHLVNYLSFINKNPSYVALSSCSVAELTNRLSSLIRNLLVSIGYRKNKSSCFSGHNQFIQLDILRKSGAMTSDVCFGEDHNRIYGLARYIKRNKLGLNIASSLKYPEIGNPVYTSGRRFYKYRNLIKHYIFTIKNKIYKNEYIIGKDEFGYPIYRENKKFKNIR